MSHADYLPKTRGTSHRHASRKPMNHDQIWYREPWLWFVLTPLIVVVLVSAAFVTVAVRGADDIVSDNYYKEGRMLAQEYTAEEYAKRLGLEADIVFDRARSEILFTLNQVVDIEELALLISHPAKSDLDHVVMFTRAGLTRYRAALPARLEGRWYLRATARGVSGASAAQSSKSAPDNIALGHVVSSSAGAGSHQSDLLAEVQELWRLHGEVDFRQSGRTILE